MNKKYLIGVDSGTSRIKAVLFDFEGNELKSKGIELNAITLYEDWYEQDMNEVWQKGLLCIKEVITGIDPKEIAGIGLSGQGDGLWMIDRNGEPVRPGICFCDGRTSQIIDKWREDGTLEKVFDISGTVVFGSSMSAEIVWLEKNEPECLDKATSFFHVKDWLFYKMTGEIFCDDTDMSIPMLNVKTRKYDDRLFSLFGIEKYRDKFPVVREAANNMSKISTKIAAEIGLEKDLYIVGGPIDVSACALSSGVIDNGQALSIIGTAAVHSVIIDTPDIKPRMLGMTIMHSREDRWIRFMSSLCGIPNLEWFLENIGAKLYDEAKSKGINIYDYCSEVVNNVPIGSNGVIYYPYLLAGGERAPFFKSNIKASFQGISFNTTTNDLLRSVYEGVALAMVDCYRVIPTQPTEIFVTGGGSNSDVWMQIFADATGKEIVRCNGKEHGARGAAMNCGVALGIYSDHKDAIRRVVKENKRFFPNQTNHEKYKKLFELYRSGYQMNMEWWDIRSDFLKK